MNRQKLYVQVFLLIEWYKGAERCSSVQVVLLKPRRKINVIRAKRAELYGAFLLLRMI